MDRKERTRSERYGGLPVSEADGGGAMWMMVQDVRLDTKTKRVRTTNGRTRRNFE